MTLGITATNEQQHMTHRISGWKVGLAAMALGGLLASHPASAYEEITVSDGGTLSGVVKLQATVPKPRG